MAPQKDTKPYVQMPEQKTIFLSGKGNPWFGDELNAALNFIFDNVPSDSTSEMLIGEFIDAWNDHKVFPLGEIQRIIVIVKNILIFYRNRAALGYVLSEKILDTLIDAYSNNLSIKFG